MNQAVTVNSTYLIIACFFYISLAYTASRWGHKVATKLPAWLDQDWRNQAETFLEKQDATAEPGYAWWTPWGGVKSEKKAARWLPVIGPLVSKEYSLFVFDIGMLLTTTVLAMYSQPLAVLTGVIFIGMLLCASLVDYRTQLLPDCITLPLMWFGIAFSIAQGTVQQSVTGAILGFMLLWVLQKGYYLIRKVDGMGGGDLKLMAAIGAWLGMSLVPAALGIGALAGLVYALMAAVKTRSFGRLPFGPSLAFAGILLYLAQPFLQPYLQLG